MDLIFSFFFQAEDGIRAGHVTGVQTCALPISLDDRTAGMLPTQLAQGLLVTHLAVVGAAPFERRPLSIAAALEEAGELASLRAELEPVPSLVPEDQDLAPQDEEPEAG